MGELIVGVIITLIGSIITAIIAAALSLAWPFWAILIIWAALVFGGILIVDEDWFD